MTDKKKELPNLQFSIKALMAGPRTSLEIVGGNVVKFYGVDGKEAYHFVFSALKKGVIEGDMLYLDDLETLGHRSNDDNVTFIQIALELPSDKGIYCCIGLPAFNQ